MNKKTVACKENTVNNKTVNGTHFDSWEVSINGKEQNEWGRICEACAEKYKFSRSMLDAGNDSNCTCGVVGCSNHAHYRINFTAYNYVKNMKTLAKKYGFKVVATRAGADLLCKNTDGENVRWIKYNRHHNSVSLVGNTDNCNLWFGETRPDLTPERLIEFVKDLNEALEINPPYHLKDLIDPEDWQSIADIRDADEDSRYTGN